MKRSNMKLFTVYNYKTGEIIEHYLSFGEAIARQTELENKGVKDICINVSKL